MRRLRRTPRRAGAASTESHGAPRDQDGTLQPVRLTAAARLIGRRSTLTSANSLGEIQAVRELNENTLARRRRVLGEDHPDTLASASTLARVRRTLGDYQTARDLNRDTLARRRRVMGEDHPLTLVSISQLTADLRALGEA